LIVAICYYYIIQAEKSDTLSFSTIPVFHNRNFTVNSDNTKILTELGFTALESMIYLALIDNPPMTGYGISKIICKPVANTYKAIESLSAKGAVLCENSGKGLVSAVHPKDLHEILQHSRKKEFENQQQKSQNIFSDLGDRFSQQLLKSDSHDQIKVIRGVEQNHHNFIKTMEQTEFEVLEITQSPYILLKDEYTQKIVSKAFGDMLIRGVKIKCIYKNENELYSLYPIITEEVVGEESYVKDELPMKMYIYDRRKVAFALPTDATSLENLTMINIEDEGFANFCVYNFNNLLKESITLEEWAKANYTKRG
jgi:sugar-specific transcriptional regulator TrmB